MEQRVLRLGDLVDDYCPRERRVTDHVIVALVDDAIRQTRCAACESEHEYKEARMPRKKLKPEDGPSLAGGVLVVPKSAHANGHADDVAGSPAGSLAAAPDQELNQTEQTASGAAAAPPTDDRQDEGEAPALWAGHRPLIRATLPKTENDVPPPRAIPEFTMHQRQGRGFGGRSFRPYGFGGGSSNNGNGNGGREPDGNRAPGPGGPGGGPGGGGPGGKGRHRRRHRRPR